MGELYGAGGFILGLPGCDWVVLFLEEEKTVEGF